MTPSSVSIEEILCEDLENAMRAIHNIAPYVAKNCAEIVSGISGVHFLNSSISADTARAEGVSIGTGSNTIFSVVSQPT